MEMRARKFLKVKSDQDSHYPMEKANPRRQSVSGTMRALTRCRSSRATKFERAASHASHRAGGRTGRARFVHGFCGGGAPSRMRRTHAEATTPGASGVAHPYGAAGREVCAERESRHETHDVALAAAAIRAIERVAGDTPRAGGNGTDAC